MGTGTIFFGDAAPAATLSRAVARGALRRLARGVYTDDLSTSAEQLVRRNRWRITARFFPDALIADRSAVNQAGEALFVVSNARATALQLPGLRVVPRKGSGPLADDPSWADGLRISSRARGLVDNLGLSRGRGGVARTLARPELEDWIAHLVQTTKTERINRLRDRAREIAAEFGVPERGEEIDRLIGAQLGTQAVRRRGRLFSAQARGRGWDPRRVELLRNVAHVLGGLEPRSDVPEELPALAHEERTLLPLHEAYFSNFIEGTEFTLDEAARIVEDGEIPQARPEDAHDILGTYHAVADPQDRRTLARDADEFLTLLRRRHRVILAGRPGARPGEWKTRANQAGSYVFVAPDLVPGTLIEAFPLIDTIPSAFGRAVFSMFAVSEVHPFEDGNGRLARVAMNAELSAAGQTRILIPIVWRNEYFTALRRASVDGNIELLVRTLAHAWRWTAQIDWRADHTVVRSQLDAAAALVDSTEAAETGWRLLLPSDL